MRGPAIRKRYNFSYCPHMTPDRWQQIKALFNRALECEAETRLGFVRAECGEDDELRREVESLLEAD